MATELRSLRIEAVLDAQAYVAGANAKAAIRPRVGAAQGGRL